MKIKQITSDDIYRIESWYEDRGAVPPEPYDYPEVGFIVDDIAAVFVYQTDASFVVVEGLISNKKVSAEERALAIKALYLAVVEFADKEQYTKILAITDHGSVVNFLTEEQFSPLRHIVFMKELL